ncbi:voltage-dependent T-type calcium channel subunit alpha-1I-like [Labeo rohita]|uniref:voltage-dependent T-type calcium channel subunit alpha-1I-like n=1 Tax=Labeo rohita TaxID=84645 RepID=UPI0021E25643|nr:voltage-dependent T-type calcium channel subunit alpha-1I-like [Labeo rohita]
MWIACSCLLDLFENTNLTKQDRSCEGCFSPEGSRSIPSSTGGSKAMTSEEEGPAAMGAEPHTDLCASPAWDGLVEEEAEPAEQEEAGVVDQAEQVQEVADDVSSELSALVVPYPELAHIVFFCLKQTTCPRNWCIRMVSSPYP